MGIKRLTSDLKPYGETVILGHNVSTTRPYPTHAVIDGPSMVYYLFYKLQSYKSQLPDRHAFDVLPTYVELGGAVEVFMDTLEEQDIKVRAIIFDGGLPISKRPTRLERLEDVRRQLEYYRRSSPRIETTNRIHELQRPDIATAIWTSSSNSAGSSLPAPPFIVPTAIDLLRSTKYAESVQVVAGEADAHCATAARQDAPNTAILSADSDLLMYEDAQDATIVPFSSLTLTTNKDEHGRNARCICAEGWTPSKIAKHLSLPSLQHFGFHRHIDGSASTLEILQRAKAALNESQTEQWTSFTKQYTSRPPVENTWEVDPRLAELICQLSQLNPGLSSKEAHMYLPPVFEDPTRDASWTYARQTRQIAYSLLALHCRSQRAAQSPNNHIHECVYEYARSGQRIGRSCVPILPLSKLRKEVEEFVMTHGHKPQLNHAASTDERIPAWLRAFLYSLKQIAAAKHEAGKDLDVRSVQALLGLSPTTRNKPSVRVSTGSDTDPGWARQHLLANVHAANYSARMLGQVLVYISAAQLRQSPNAKVKSMSKGVYARQPEGAKEEAEAEAQIHALAEKLRSVQEDFALGAIQDIFLTQSELLVRAGDVDRRHLWAALRRAFAEFDIKFPSDPVLQKSSDRDTGFSGAAGNGDEAFERGARRGKRKRKRERKKSAEEKKQLETRAARASSNPFAALDSA